MKYKGTVIQESLLDDWVLNEVEVVGCKVTKEDKFAVEGDMEYVTVDVPAFYLDQSEEIESK